MKIAIGNDHAGFELKKAIVKLLDEKDVEVIDCSTGVGMSISANKINGIRCVVRSEPYTAKLSRNHNNINVLALGGRVIGSELAKMIVNTWIDEQFEGEKRYHSYNLITELEEKNRK